MARALAAFPSCAESDLSFGITEFEPLLNSHQAARLLSIHHKTLQKLARRGDISGTHVGKLWRFRASALNAWLDQQKRAG